MTNEEILKRFQFDLEMGFFKVDKWTSYPDQDSIIFKSNDNRKLVKVLNALGFKGGYPIYMTSPILIYLNSGLLTKKYHILVPYFKSFKVSNEIPDYINLYNEEESNND